jgi:prepilin-type N-terminal cleavage/methylation domain-containing protein
MVRRVRRQRGFTLIELMVAGVVALIVLGGAIALLLQGSTMLRRQREVGNLNRDATRVLGQLSQELRQAGLGRPRGARLVIPPATGTGELFLPTFIRAEQRQVGFVVDVPRPNSNFNGISYVADDAHALLFATPTALAILNELNGGCDVFVTAGCNTKDHSTLFASTDSANVSCSSDSKSPSCPWGLRKYQESEYVIMADAAGRWTELQLAASGATNPPILTLPLGIRKTLNFTTAIPAEMVNGQPNRAVISTPDRVFYRLVLDGTGPLYRLERQQCWARLANPAVTLAGARADCSGGGFGTPWEVLLRGLKEDAISFKYLDAAGAPLETELASTTAEVAERALRRIRRVNIELKLERQPRIGGLLTHSSFVSINVRN